MSDIANQNKTRDRYTFIPAVIFMPIAVVEGLLWIFEPGGLLGSPQFWIALLMLFVSSIVWLVAVLIALVIRRWRCLLSMILAGPLSLATLALLISFGDQIHYQIMRQYYLSEIAQSNGANQRYWEWRGGLGWDEGVVFDRSDLALSKDDQQNNCKISNRPVAQHFYVQFVNCQ
jgi:hypothetical protein